MQQFQLELDNKELEQSLQEVEKEIDEEIYVDDDFIVEDLKNVLDQMEENDKTQSIKYLNIKYKDRKFLQLGKFLVLERIEEENAEEVLLDFDYNYENLKKNKMHQKLIKMLGNSKYCEKYSIPIIIQQHIKVVAKLQIKTFDLLEIINNEKLKSSLNQFQLLITLLQFIYNKLPYEQEQNTLEIIIGSLLINSIYEFQFYIETVKQQDKILFKEFIEYVQNQQMKVFTCQETSQKILENKDLNFLSSLFLSDVIQSKQDLDNYLREILKLKDEIPSFQKLKELFECFIIQEIDIQKCYFRVVWYLWTTFVCQSEFIQQLHILEIKRQKVGDQKKILQRFLISAKKIRPNDIILDYFIQRNVFLQEKYESQNYEHYSQSQIFLISELERFQLNEKKFEDLISLPGDQFIQIWVITCQLSFHQLFDIQYKSDIVRKILLFMWVNKDVDKSVQQNLGIFLKLRNLTLDICFKFLLENYSTKPICFLVNFFQILATIQGYNSECIEPLLVFIQSKRQEGWLCLCKFSQLLAVKNQTLNNFKLFKQFDFYDWNIIYQYVNSQSLINFIKATLEIYQIELENKKIKYCLVLFQKYLPLLPVEKITELQALKFIIQMGHIYNFHQILVENKTNIPRLSIVNKTLEFFYSFYDLAKEKNIIITELFLGLQYFLRHDFYKLKIILKLKNSDIPKSLINKIIQAFYFSNAQNQKELQNSCISIYKENAEIYTQCFKSNSYFQSKLLSPQILSILKANPLYPINMEIKLEQFNFSLVEMKREELEAIVSEWINDMQDQSKFFKLIPFLFNIIKRNDSPEQFLNMINDNKPLNFLEHFNMKAIFQLLYNNSNNELKVMLLKLRSQLHPVPFIFQKIIQEITCEDQLYELNQNLYYIFPSCYTVINFTLTQNSGQIGKTYLLNQIFYDETAVFETLDTSEINRNTIDIMFDFPFNGSREFAVADSHGFIPISILKKILPLFQLWIIQHDSEQDIFEAFEEIQNLEEIIKEFQPEICFIIRNSQKEKRDQLMKKINKMKSEKIDVFYVQNLFPNNLNNTLNAQNQSAEINNVSKLILPKLNKIVQQNKKMNNMDFIRVLKQYNEQKEHLANIFDTMLYDAKILQDLEEEMKRLVDLPFGFYNKQAFPSRGAGQQFAKQKKKYLFNQELNDFQEQSINYIDEPQNETQQTKILKLFCSIFEKGSSNYVLYLQFVDRVKKFNEIQMNKLQLQQEKLLNNLQEKKKEKIAHLNDETYCFEIKKQIEIIKNKLNQIEFSIFTKNIGIEIFWREIIQQPPNQLPIDPAKIYIELIEKGEPLEFLDGDEFTINQKFLSAIFDKFAKNGKEKILVLSVLGPQSSGKSTILNKIFGCHFWTSVGRCTKGIYLQLLKIHNKSLFAGNFDFLLLLDTEGLQNPNQKDPDFDKRIALFVLLISDIIIINVKGDIHSQFKNLVEMCIYTLGQMTIDFQLNKLLSWCFNLNNEINNIEPFLGQIKGISDNIKKDINQDENHDIKLDYNEILDIKKDNLKILGFSFYETKWKKSDYFQKYLNCWYLKQNDSFSLEAYQYGLETIKKFFKKFPQNSLNHKNSLLDLKKFVQNVAENWKIIQRLPELLEFTQLIEHQQNNCMKSKFDKSLLALDRKINDILSLIKPSIYEVIEITTSFRNISYFNEIQQKFELQFIQKINQEKEETSQSLEGFSQQNKLSKKIFEKYQKLFDQYLIGKEIECKTLIFDGVKFKQIQYQQEQAKYLLNQELKKNIEDQSLRSYNRKNPEQRRKIFDQLWEQIFEQENEKHMNTLFMEFQTNQYDQMIKYNQNCLLATEHDKFYKEFLQNLNKNQPETNEFQQIFNIFKQELGQQQFMQFPHYQKSNRYHDLFQQDIINKLKAAKDEDVVDIRLFYKYQVNYICFGKEEVYNYLQTDFFEDLKKIILKVQKSPHYKQSRFDFFILLNELQIEYNQEQLESYLDKLQSKEFSVDCFSFQEEEKQFQKSIKKIDKSKKIHLTNNEIISVYQLLYPSLLQKCNKFKKTFKLWSEIEEHDQNIFENQIIFERFISAKSKDRSEYLLYVKDPNDKEKDFDKLLPEVTSKFSTLICFSQGWNKLYSQIYDLIRKEIFSQNSLNCNQNNDEIELDDQISSFNFTIQKNILKKIEKAVMDFNNQFAIYGVILNQIGERCIYYFSLLIIWRFGCEKKWQILTKHQNKLQREKLIFFKQFEQDFQKIKQQDILEDYYEEREIYAYKLISTVEDEIRLFILNKCQNDQVKNIQQRRLSSQELVDRLDQEILLQNCNNAYIRETEKQKIISYIQNQLLFIQNYTYEYVTKTKTEIKAQVSENQPYKLFFIKEFSKIKANGKLIFDQITENKQEAKDFFYSNENQEEKLYDLVFNCLLGMEYDKKNQIIPFFKSIFDQKFEKITIPVKLTSINPQYKKIRFLQSFIKHIFKMIEQVTKKVENDFDLYPRLSLEKYYEELKLDMIGCIFQCPMCNRKCDLAYHDYNQKHQCTNGHYLRGMNSVLIGPVPSLLACDEIKYDYCIRDKKTKKIHKWIEIVKKYPEWQFQNYENQSFGNKMSRIWNGGIGHLLCQITNHRQQNQPVIFKRKYDFNSNEESSHHIFIIESSSFIQKEDYEKAEKRVLHCVKQLESYEAAHVSIITLDKNAKIRYEALQPRLCSKSNNYIWWNSGNPNLSVGLNAFIDQLNKFKNSNYSRTILFMYTSGMASYPKQAVENFKKLEENIRSTVTILMATASQNSALLSQIVNELKLYCHETILFPSTEADKIKLAWEEAVSKGEK